MKIFKKLVVFALCTPLLFTCLQGEEKKPIKNPYPQLLAVGAGIFNVCKSTNNTGILQLEYKGPDFFGKRILKIRPFAAVMGSFEATFWFGAGVNFDIYFGRPIVLTLGFGPGFYFKGSSRKNLGYPLEMRSSVELAYRFYSNARFGVQFYHLSNGSMSSKNPGTEVLTVFYAFPLY